MLQKHMDEICDDSVKEFIRVNLSYDPETGHFTWIRSPSNRVKVGQVAGSLCKYRGYRSIRVLGKLYLAHRLAFISMGKSVPEYVDHVNGIKDDNRWVNLRGATFSQNQQNKVKQRNNTSGYKGVSWNNSRKKWQAHITVDRKTIYLGLYINPKEAHEAYKKAADNHFGDYKNYGGLGR